MAQDVVVMVSEPGADAGRLERLSLQLRDELVEADLGKVGRHTTGSAPEGTRSAELAEAGALVISAAGSFGTLGQVVEIVRQWLRRGNAAREVEINLGDKHLRLTASSSSEQDQLVRAFLAAIEEERQR